MKSKIFLVIALCSALLGIMLPPISAVTLADTDAKSLQVENAGTVQVSTNLDDASFAVSNGTLTVKGKGRNWSWLNAPLGQYT